MKIDRSFVTDTQKECTGILKSPQIVGNDEMSLDIQSLAVRLNLDRKR